MCCREVLRATHPPQRRPHARVVWVPAPALVEHQARRVAHSGRLLGLGHQQPPPDLQALVTLADGIAASAARAPRWR